MKIIYDNNGRDSLVVNSQIMIDEHESIKYLNCLQESQLKDDYTIKINSEYKERISSPLKKTYRVTIAGLGDVGGNVLLGLKLFGQPTISEIRIFNPDAKVAKRYALEMNQIYNENFKLDVPVKVISEDEVFDTDVFIFTASKSVPAVGDEKIDVRKAQFADNSRIIAHYSKIAKAKLFKGLFLVVSDPVDLLCKVAFDSSENWLIPSQIAGFGQGVMYARACYYAQEMGLEYFKEEGRIFGPHGSELIVANSLKNYDNELSLKLTELAITANLKIRDLGFKPYIAPAFSSGALSILSYLRGQMVYSSQYLNGHYYGLYGKLTGDGLLIEVNDIPNQLMERIENSYNKMVGYYEENKIDFE